MALAQLCVDIGHPLPHVLPQPDEIVVNRNEQQHQTDDKHQNRRSPEPDEKITHDA